MFDLTRDGNIAVVAMNHGKVNAMDTAMCEGLAETLRDLDSDDTVRAVVLAGNGSTFGAGVDLPAFQRLDLDGVRRFLVALGEVFMTPIRMDKPIIAAVDGHAIAGGAILALSCDEAYVTDSDRARIGLTELAVGVPFPPVPIEIVRARLRSTAPVLSARLFRPEAAVAQGFGTAVVPADELLAHAMKAATRLAAVPPVTMAMTKASLRRPIEAALVGTEDDLEATVVAWASDEVQQAMTAFLASLG